MKTYEIFTEDGSQIIQAKNMASAIGRHGLVSGNIDKELIAIIEVERGQEFLTRYKQLPIHDVSYSEIDRMPIEERDALNADWRAENLGRGRYCEDCGDYVKNGCDNKDCKDYKGCS